MSAPIDNAVPSPWDVVFSQAVQFHSSGQLAQAASLFVAILEHNPAHFPSIQRLASIRRQQDRLQESLDLLQVAVDCNPESAEVRNSLGNTLNAFGRPEEAIQQYRQAVALRDNFPEAHFNIGNCLKSLGLYQEAAVAYGKVTALRPDYVDAHTNLGVVFRQMNRPAEALTSFSAALSIDPQVKSGYSNLGMALTELNRHQEAIPFFHLARQLEPDAPEPLFNEAITQLGLGNYELGWPLYEARWQLPHYKLEPQRLTQPLWDGELEISGKTLLLRAEQGLGDSILFARFIEPTVRKGARVVLAVQKPLLKLFGGIPGVQQVLLSSNPLPEYDFHLPFGSLPNVFKTTLATIPSQTPYLQAPAESDTLAKLSNSTGSRPLVGVCWAGNPNYFSDHKRSIPLSNFQHLFQVQGIRFISLQQNLRIGDDSILTGFDNIDLTDLTSDRKGHGLADTAALISKLDLVITVDTAIAHLAGALGRPVWIVLPFCASWRWLRERADSPWYPTARLFRQLQPGDWETPVADVTAALKKFCH